MCRSDGTGVVFGYYMALTYHVMICHASGIGLFKNFASRFGGYGVIDELKWPFYIKGLVLHFRLEFQL